MRKEFEGREEFSKEEIENWFDHAKPEEIENGVIWINEPHHFEDVYCYLVLGKKKDLLIDTGMGIKPITPLLDQLRNPGEEPIVVNTHWHFDHIGGNSEFSNVYIPNSAKEKFGIMTGWTSEMMQKYGFFDGFWHNGSPSDFIPENFSISGYSKIKTAPNEFDLGGRIIKVINTPGHSPGSICLFDETNGLLFTGDTLYEGPLYAFEEESNPDDYLESLKNIAKLPAKSIHPGHNHPSTKNFPNLVQEATELFERVKRREKWDAEGEFPNTIEYHLPEIKSERRLKVVVNKNHVSYQN